MDRDTDVFWGALCGTIVGFIVAKVYETWAILFSRYGVGTAGFTSMDQSARRYGCEQAKTRCWSRWWSSSFMELSVFCSCCISIVGNLSSKLAAAPNALDVV